MTPPSDPTKGPAPLDSEQRSELLRIARQTLEVCLSGAALPATNPKDPRLREPSGAFVTLRRNAQGLARPQLRGCIGTFEQTHPLAETVSRMAVAAATNDPRFAPVLPVELPDLNIEISVLSPRRIAQPADIQLGVHGIYVTRESQRGVLLPQVAIECGWDRETFLEQTCRKAQLPADAWQRPETRIEIFTAQVFGEEDSPTN